MCSSSASVIRESLLSVLLALKNSEYIGSSRNIFWTRYSKHINFSAFLPLIGGFFNFREKIRTCYILLLTCLLTNTNKGREYVPSCQNMKPQNVEEQKDATTLLYGILAFMNYFAAVYTLSKWCQYNTIRYVSYMNYFAAVYTLSKWCQYNAIWYISIYELLRSSVYSQ